jgi:hypothetical protein
VATDPGLGQASKLSNLLGDRITSVMSTTIWRCRGREKSSKKVRNPFLKKEDEEGRLCSCVCKLLQLAEIFCARNFGVISRYRQCLCDVGEKLDKSVRRKCPKNGSDTKMFEMSDGKQAPVREILQSPFSIVYWLIENFRETYNIINYLNAYMKQSGNKACM